MDFKDFAEDILREISYRGVKAELKTFRTVNNTEKHSIIINTESVLPVNPAIQLDPFYEKYKEGLAIDKIADIILCASEEGMDNFEFDPAIITDWEKCRKLIRPKLINIERNREMLDRVVYTQLLDLALIYVIRLDLKDQSGAVTIDQDLMNTLKVTENDLYEAASENCKDEVVFKSLLDLMTGMCGISDDVIEEDDDQDSLKVLGNTMGVDGAGVIANKDVLIDVSKKLDSDLIMLPSSRHEWLVLSARNHYGDYQSLKEMVMSVNSEVVEEKDYLSDSVYFYDRTLQEMSIVA